MYKLKKLVIRVFSSIFILVIYVILFSAISTIKEDAELRMISNDFYSDKSIKVSIGEPLENSINIDGDGGYVVFALAQESEDETLIGVLSNDFSPYFELQSGRFISIEDAIENKKVAVVGAAYSDKVQGFAENDVFIDINGEAYRVVGVIKEYGAGRINGNIYYSVDLLMDGKTLFCIDGKNDTKKILNQLLGSITEFSIIDSYSDEISRLVNGEFNSEFLFILAFIICIFIALVRAYIVYRDKKRIALVLDMYSSKQIKIALYLIKETLCSFSVFAVALLIFCILDVTTALLSIGCGVTIGLLSCLLEGCYYLACMKLYRR